MQLPFKSKSDNVLWPRLATIFHSCNPFSVKLLFSYYYSLDGSAVMPTVKKRHFGRSLFSLCTTDSYQRYVKSVPAFDLFWSRVRMIKMYILKSSRKCVARRSRR